MTDAYKPLMEMLWWLSLIVITEHRPLIIREAEITEDR